MRIITLFIVLLLLGGTEAQARAIPAYNSKSTCYRYLNLEGHLLWGGPPEYYQCIEDQEALAERLKGRRIPEAMLRRCDEEVWVEGGFWGGSGSYIALEACLLEAAFSRKPSARARRIPSYNVALGCAWQERDRLEAKTGRSVENFTEDEILLWKRTIPKCKNAERSSLERLKRKKRIIARAHMRKCDKNTRKGAAESYIALETCINDLVFPKREAISMGNLPVYDIRKEMCKSSTPPTNTNKECEELAIQSLNFLKGLDIPKDVIKACEEKQKSISYALLRSCVIETLSSRRDRARQLIVPEEWKQRPDR